MDKCQVRPYEEEPTQIHFSGASNMLGDLVDTSNPVMGRLWLCEQMDVITEVTVGWLVMHLIISNELLGNAEGHCA